MGQRSPPEFHFAPRYFPRQTPLFFFGQTLSSAKVPDVPTPRAPTREFNQISPKIRIFNRPSVPPRLSRRFSVSFPGVKCSATLTRRGCSLSAPRASRCSAMVACAGYVNTGLISREYGRVRVDVHRRSACPPVARVYSPRGARTSSFPGKKTLDVLSGQFRGRTMELMFAPRLRPSTGSESVHGLSCLRAERFLF